MSITPDGQEITAEQGSPALHGDARRSDGAQEVLFRSFAGSQSNSRLASGTLMVSVLPPVEVGQQGELAVANVLTSRLRGAGHNLGEPEVGTNRDDDIILPINGSRVPVQVVTIPASPTFWREVAQGSATTTVRVEQAAAWVYEALAEKARKYPPELKKNMILAVDCRFAGAAVALPVVQSYEQQFGDPLAVFGFGAVWLVGAQDSRCTQLGLGR